MTEAKLTATAALTDRVFVYPGRNEAALEDRRYAEQGAVLHGDSGLRVAHRLRSSGSQAVLLVDPAAYVNLKRGPDQLFDRMESAVTEQAAVKPAAFLSPSGPPPRDAHELEHLLAEGEKFTRLASAHSASTPAYVVVPVTERWLGAELSLLRTQLSGREFRTALVFASAFDALSSPSAIAGALELLEDLIEPLILRCDLSAIGLMANGAIASAVGTSASTRHLGLPIRRAKDAPRKPNQAHALLHRFMSWPGVDLLGHVEPASPLFDCPCVVCEGRSELRFRDEAFAVEAQAHSVEAVRQLAARILEATDRASAWAAACRRALDAHAELKEQQGVAFDLPRSVRAWTQV